MSERRVAEEAVRPAALWFGLLGGAVAWTLHLLLAYLTAEFGCLSGLRDMRFLDTTAVAWLALVLSVAMTAVAVAATVVADRSRRRVDVPERDVVREPEFSLIRAAVIMNLWFVFIIVVQSVPIFFFLRTC